MNKIYSIGILSLVFFGSISARAEDLIKFPSGPAAWTVEISRVDQAESLGAGSSDSSRKEALLRLTRVEVDQDNQVRRSVVKTSDGKSRESWSIAGFGQILTEDPNGTVFFSGESIPFDRSAFDWIKAETLQEKEPVKYKGKACLHYKTEIKVVENGVYQGTLHYEAWIDSATLLPVALQSNNDMGTFSFNQPPTGPLTAPAKFKMPLENKKRAMGLP